MDIELQRFDSLGRGTLLLLLAHKACNIFYQE